MAEKSVPDDLPFQPVEPWPGVYVDSSALAKLYVPEVESERLDEFLRGRTDLMISDLCITEVMSAIARRRREGVLEAKQANEIRAAVLADAKSGSFRKLDLTPAIHREAERLLFSTESVALRTLDALHIALAVTGLAQRVVTFDSRMKAAAALHGLEIVELSSEP
jgi:predicted nucleic acid-binding protein